MIYLYNILRYIEKIPDCTHVDISVFTGDVVGGNCANAMMLDVPKDKIHEQFQLNMPIVSLHTNLKNAKNEGITYIYADQKNAFSDGRNITKEIERVFDDDRSDNDKQKQS